MGVTWVRCWSAQFTRAREVGDEELIADRTCGERLSTAETRAGRMLAGFLVGARTRREGHDGADQNR
jgi:hypothetical protein